MKKVMMIGLVAVGVTAGAMGEDSIWKPYSPPCVERENIFEFAEKPKVKNLGNDRYEITFATKANCDVTVAIVDPDPTKELVKGKGVVVRHLASGVLGSNAPLPFQPSRGGSASGGKDSLKQTIYWNGKDDLDVYHKTPEKLVVRVSLGLKPEFDKLLLGASPYNLPGYAWGIAVGPDGGYVFSKMWHLSVRKFDRNGNYVMSLTPPPADLPEAKLEGLGFVEYAANTRAVHSRGTYQTVAANGWILPAGNDARTARASSPILLGTRLYYADQAGFRGPIGLHHLNTDGSTTRDGIDGGMLVGDHIAYLSTVNLAAAPDGKAFYATYNSIREPPPTVYRFLPESGKPGVPFIGDEKVPGSDNAHFSSPRGLDCDGEGRLYVCDQNNNRLQVFSPEGQHLKTVPVSRPVLVKLHRRSGGIYILHFVRSEGKTVGRLTKLKSFQNPEEEYHVDHLGGHQLAVDEWSAKPRLWVAGTATVDAIGGTAWQPSGSVRIFEEEGGTLVKIADFAERAAKEEGENHIGCWGGMGDTFEKVNADPLREEVYFRRNMVFDLTTGKFLREVSFSGTDIAFDKRGFMHVHFNPGSYFAGVGRLDPNQATAKPWTSGERERGRASPWSRVTYAEVPYDYGVEGSKDGWSGVIETKDQPGAKFFQDGIGVNMQGDVAENCNIYFVPKMDDLTLASGWGLDKRLSGGDHGAAREACLANSYANFVKRVQNAEMRGEHIYSIRRQPGVPLSGGTIWTFERSGELRLELAVNAGDLINGVQMDEDGAVYFVTARPRMYGDRDFFLKGKAGQFGAGAPAGHPFTGTLVKTRPNAPCRILMASAPMPMDTPPDRAPDLMGVDYMDEAYMGKNSWCWVEGAEWMYAGASPIVSVGCSCPTQRMHLDWYKRVFVPEAYRHSFGVLDTAGNLIMHLGQYGNYDSGFGAESKIPVGGDNIAVFMPRFISGTDNYLIFSDWGERLAVLKIAYHAEETVGIE